MTSYNVLQTLFIGTLSMTFIHAYDIDLERQRLKNNEDKWDSFAGNAGYTMKYTSYCFCPPEWRGPFQVTVNSTGEVESAIYAEGSQANLVGTPASPSHPITIDDAFEEIQKALDQEAYDLDVTYDAVAGYPSDVSIDWDVMIADEETNFKIEDVRADSCPIGYCRPSPDEDCASIVYCFVDPCSLNPCNAGEQCVSNYCGGCNHECVKS